MNPAIRSAAEPELVHSRFFNSELPESISPDAEGKFERGFSYGIASVFAMMLVLVVTLCAMLWIR